MSNDSGAPCEWKWNILYLNKLCLCKVGCLFRGRILSRSEMSHEFFFLSLNQEEETFIISSAFITFISVCLIYRSDSLSFLQSTQTPTASNLSLSQWSAVVVYLPSEIKQTVNLRTVTCHRRHHQSSNEETMKPRCDLMSREPRTRWDTQDWTGLPAGPGCGFQMGQGSDWLPKHTHS